MPQRAHEIARVAREQLGFESLRPGQEEAIRAILDGHDTLVVQPTGSGKSAIYQIAGLLMSGSTIVVSPLIALQKDQVDSLEDVPADAVAVNSAQPAADVRTGLKRVTQGKIEYIFLAPEQLRRAETVEMLKSARISLFVIDEAHCVSEWGHDFRPDYLRLDHVIQALEHPLVVALTATATPRVRDEIVRRLGMRNVRMFVRSFDRPNIYLRVDSFKSEGEKREALVHRVVWADKPGIVYTSTRKAAEEIMRDLEEQNITAVFYHGGLKARERHEIQERFMSGDAEVIVATNAFGMGVDKPNVRFVYHHGPSDSLDAYYQEVGRAGRDGEKAEAILFYREKDIGAQSFKTGEGRIEPETLQHLAERIAQEDGPVAPEEVAAGVKLSPRKLTSALQRLEDVGAAETLPDGRVRGVPDADPEAAAQARGRGARNPSAGQTRAAGDDAPLRRDRRLTPRAVAPLFGR
ncbi:MAG TPA: RecQ family ATP-dependent DNA helicase [Bryobacteraceae bacterium]